MTFPAMPNDKTRMEEWCSKYLPELFQSGTIKPNPIQSFSGGLDNITEGLNYIKEGKVQRAELVRNACMALERLTMSCPDCRTAASRSPTRSKSRALRPNADLAGFAYLGCRLEGVYKRVIARREKYTNASSCSQSQIFGDADF